MKKLLVTCCLAYNFLSNPVLAKEESTTPNKALVAGGAAVGGAVAGYGVVAATGLTAVGAVGSGVGVGAAAGPVGMAAGAVTGLAAYGVYRALEKDKTKSKKEEDE